MVKTFKSKNLENNNLDIETLFKEVEKVTVQKILNI